MGFPKLFAAIKRVLPKQRNEHSVETVEYDDEDAESWRGSLRTGTEDWNRIQEGQRMLQLSTSLWFGTDRGPFDMKDDERYELLYGRPIGVEDPVLEALRMQMHQTPGGIYVEPGRTARESSSFTNYTSNYGLLPAHDVDRAAPRLSQASPVEACSNETAPAQSGESSSSDPAYSESRCLTNLESFQRKLQPSMSWQYRMTRFQCSSLVEAMQSSAGVERQVSTPIVDWERPQATMPTPAPEAQVNQASCRTSGTTVPVSASPDSSSSISLHVENDGAGVKAASPPVDIPTPHACINGISDEQLRHMAWRWRFTKRWCKERTEPQAEMSRRDEIFAEALAGAPSDAWSHLLRNTSTDGGVDRDPNMLSESIPFSDFGEDTAAELGAPGGRWPQWGGGRTTLDRAPGRLSTDSRASSHLNAAMVNHGQWHEGRIRGGE